MGGDREYKKRNCVKEEDCAVITAWRKDIEA